MILRRVTSLPSWPRAFGELDDMRRGIERLLGALPEALEPSTAGVFPAVNLSENGESVVVRAELPGMKSDDLEITIGNGTLTVAGERAMPAESERASYHRREREWGRFRRSVSIPVPIDPTRTEAHYRDGILTITLSKAPEARPKQIAIQAEA